MMMTARQVLVISLFMLGNMNWLAACDDTESPDGGGTAGTSSASGGCVGLSEDECIERRSQGCDSLYGWTTEGSRFDSNTYEYVGCRDGEKLCSTAISCGLNPATGECWGFPDTCIPDEWVHGNDFDCDATPPTCPTDASAPCEGEAGVGGA
jgi:hypothetical protein